MTSPTWPGWPMLAFEASRALAGLGKDLAQSRLQGQRPLWGALVWSFFVLFWSCLQFVKALL